MTTADTGPPAPAPTPPNARSALQAAPGFAIVSPGGGHAIVTGRLEHLQSTDIATGVTSEVEWPLPSAQSRLYPFVLRDRGFVVVQDSQRGPYEPQIGVAYALGTDGSAPTDLGAASYAVASRVPDRVWLMTDDATPDQRLRANVAFGRVRTVTEVDMEGRVTTPTRDLTEGRTVVGAVEGGLLTVRTDDVSSVAEVWDPASGHVRLAVAGTGTRFGAFADTFVDQSFAGCSLDRPMRIHHLASGRRSDVPPPPGSTWARAALSPDGRLLAAVATGLPRAGDMGASRFMGRVATAGTVFVFDTGTARLIGQHDVTIWDGGPGLVWSPDSRWVFAAADPERVTYFEASAFALRPRR